MMPDNTLEIMGRIDSQIKLRGVRIEAEGISNVLVDAISSSQSRISAVTIIGAHPGIGGGNEGLVSFVAPGGDRQPSVSKRKSGKKPSIILPSVDDPNQFFTASLIKSLKQAVARELPSYMRPSYIIPVSFIPLSSNGKIDNKVLGELFQAANVQDLFRIQRWDLNEFDSPSNGEPSSDINERGPTATEDSVIALVTQMTRHQDLSFRSNLFEVGLDSIKFSSLARSIRRELLSSSARPIRVSEIMGHPIIQELALVIDDRNSKGTPDNSQPPSGDNTTVTSSFDAKWRSYAEGVFDPADIEIILPPFPVQEGVIFRASQEPGHYVQHFVYRCEEKIDLDKLKDVWREVVSRQQILRCVYSWIAEITSIET